MEEMRNLLTASNAKLNANFTLSTKFTFASKHSLSFATKYHYLKISNNNISFQYLVQFINIEIIICAISIKKSNNDWHIS